MATDKVDTRSTTAVEAPATNGLQDQAASLMTTDSLAKSMKVAESMLTPQQIARVERDADIPYRYIQAAGNGGRVPQVSDHAARLQPISVETQADVTRWIRDAATIDQKNETKAKPGDSYWSIAQGVVAQRKGREGTDAEVSTMVRNMATLNGKTLAEAGNLAVGETVKIPREKKSH